MATDTQAVSIPATRTHTHTDTMTAREWRLRTLERTLLRRLRSLEHTRTQTDALEARFARVFDEICTLVIARECTCESFT